jgi:hypothetical protein
MKKLSFGDVQKIKIGSTVIWSCIFGWALINGATLIFATVKHYIN